MSNRMNVYIMGVEDSRTLVTINGTKIYMEHTPPPESSAGLKEAEIMLKEFALHWVSINVVENVKGVIHTDNVMVIRAPDKRFPKIEVLERLAKHVKSEGWMFYAKDFKPSEAESVKKLVDDGFLKSRVMWIDPENDDSYDLTPQEVEEARGTGIYYNHRGDEIPFNGKNFSSSFEATSKLVRLAQAKMEPEDLDEEDAEDIANRAKEAAFDEVVLWLNRIGLQGAEPLRIAAKTFARVLRDRGHRKGDLLVDWRPPQELSDMSENKPHRPVVIPKRDYDTSLTDKPGDKDPISPFGERNSFWSD